MGRISGKPPLYLKGAAQPLQHSIKGGRQLPVFPNGLLGQWAVHQILHLNLLGLFGKLPQRPQTPSADEIGNGAG